MPSKFLGDSALNGPINILQSFFVALKISAHAPDSKPEVLQCNLILILPLYLPQLLCCSLAPDINSYATLSMRICTCYHWTNLHPVISDSCCHMMYVRGYNGTK